ncbi:MAG: trypsin-like peptidase domain-containing protein [Roseofilum sp. SBFL]|uniref:HhoA/HhoB/HtrA family serine endopeptidase n=1 Tax=unclassified Roseofilum TaxID=2620099 RepID=UPI001B276CEA|nr:MULTISPECIES: HhoA/HhoB/HtrA family serine endopeptidase [unclassified Roseofilum]MBP0014975.1 trypsin-like peptidase domain-containing protein [Roseofilum sp. SID3]MBP0037259.1 trypsin-like peptidase domain-containing protein [Roseofilum sp. SID1]MBP0041362.1 trypsin-like peptidase domain-containing protein [Roseofilum sp. SBFL]
MTNPYPSDKPATPAPWKQPLIYITLMLLGSTLTLVGTQVLSRSPNLSTSTQQTSTTVSALPSSTTAPLVPTSNDSFVSQVVQNVGPAVVRIDASRIVTQQVPDVFNDPFFRRFFGGSTPMPQEREVRGSGSGFIINEEGMILTNAHVIEGTDIVDVTLKDGRTLEGKVLGTDPVTDVAVVKIEGENLPTVKLGNSDTLQPGEWAIAIGNPLGLDNTVTVGIISATGRSSAQVGIPDKRVSFIQTDAAINPGNSGGPLLNQNGEVIGINTAIIQGAQGLGFSIPINTAQNIADQLVSKGQVDHPYLGIQMVTLTPDLQKEINQNPNSGFKISAEQGVLIVQVMPQSPAAQAGIRAGDVITEIDGKPMREATEIQQAVQNTQVGSSLNVLIRRGDRSLPLTVRPGVFPAQ